jgi:hypothetical protein
LSTPEKINTAEAYSICSINTLDGIITSSPDSDLLKPYKQVGINVY